MNNTDEFKVDLLKVATTLQKNNGAERYYEAFDMTQSDVDRLMDVIDIKELVLESDTKSMTDMRLLQYIMETARTDEEAIYMLISATQAITEVKNKLRKLTNVLKRLEDMTDEL